MPKRGTYKPRSGYQRVAGPTRQYRDLSTGKIISRRQYIKATEGIRSLESKAKQLRQVRDDLGVNEPMRQYNAIVKQYKLTHPGEKVRGKDASEFKKLLKEYRNPKRSRRDNKNRVRAGALLGMIPPNTARELYPELFDDPALDWLDSDLNDSED